MEGKQHENSPHRIPGFRALYTRFTTSESSADPRSALVIKSKHSHRYFGSGEFFPDFFSIFLDFLNDLRRKAPAIDTPRTTFPSFPLDFPIYVLFWTLDSHLQVLQRKRRGRRCKRPYLPKRATALAFSHNASSSTHSLFPLTPPLPRRSLDSLLAPPPSIPPTTGLTQDVRPGTP